MHSNSSMSVKKRRKSRTAFTNKQIYELEKRFLYQKYLTPADRDEIAQSLSLSNAQVITWFQNRRAKLKRDVEELKADMKAAKALGVDPTPNSVLLLSSLDELLLKGSTRNGVNKPSCSSNAASCSASGKSKPVVTSSSSSLSSSYSPKSMTSSACCPSSGAASLQCHDIAASSPTSSDVDHHEISASNLPAEIQMNDNTGEFSRIVKDDEIISRPFAEDS